VRLIGQEFARFCILANSERNLAFQRRALGCLEAQDFMGLVGFVEVAEPPGLRLRAGLSLISGFCGTAKAAEMN
jgi:hypothetical protein